MVEIYSPFTVSCFFDHSFFQQFINFVLNDVLLLKGKNRLPLGQPLAAGTQQGIQFYTESHYQPLRRKMFQLASTTVIRHFESFAYLNLNIRNMIQILYFDFPCFVFCWSLFGGLVCW